MVVHRHASMTCPLAENAEAMVIQCLRMIASGYQPRPDLPARASELNRTFRDFLDLATRYTRRDLRLRTIAALSPSTDEYALTALIAAAQNGHDDELNARLRWLFKRRGLERIRIAAEQLGANLAINGFYVTLPQVAAPPARPLPLMTVVGKVAV